jgi:hypothetical protein
MPQLQYRTCSRRRGGRRRRKVAGVSVRRRDAAGRENLGPSAKAQGRQSLLSTLSHVRARSHTERDVRATVRGWWGASLPVRRRRSWLAWPATRVEIIALVYR